MKFFVSLSPPPTRSVEPQPTLAMNEIAIPLRLLLSFLALIPVFISAQNMAPPTDRNIQIHRTTQSIVLDGKLDEPIWQEAELGDGFWNKWPDDTKPAEALTEVRVLFDDQFIYVGAVCYSEKDYIIQTLKRDQGHWDSDGFAVVLDPVNKKTNGFFFGVNALNGQSEGLVPADFESFNFDWDNKWFSAVTNLPDRYIIEMAIPFKTLRYDGENKHWGINFIRNDMKRNMYSTWNYVPLNFDGIDFGYMGTMVWDKAPKPARGNISIIPYMIGGYYKDHENSETAVLTPNAGLDAKVAVSSSLNLDLTINPDFSQVEVDVQQTNLERFDLFFPERRTFFLENSDLFGSFGIPPTRPFFSRRIGLDDEVRPIPILFGARLSGNVTEKWRIGLMSMQTGAKNDFLGQNYSVGAFQRRVLKRSSVNGILLNRQAFADGKFVGDDFNRNAGLEFNYSSADGKWIAWGQYHQTFGPEKLEDPRYYNIGIGTQLRNLTYFSSYSHTGTNFDVDIGFNARQLNYDADRDTVFKLGYNILYNIVEYAFYPENQEVINRHGPKTEIVPIWNPDGSLNEISATNGYSVNFQNQSSVTAGWDYYHVNLPFPTDLIGGDEPLPVATYQFNSARAEYSSDKRKALSFTTTGRYGSFYNGKIRSFSLALLYRAQPWGNFSLTFRRDDITLPDLYGETALLLVSPRIEINFRRNLFWTTFLQYNTQNDNFNINSRLQWRFKPMSDLFVVYTDNYGTETFNLKNRGIVIKLNYWLTM